MKMSLIYTAATVTIITLLANTVIAGDLPPPARPQHDTDRIQGTWKVVNLEANGQPAPAEIIAAMKLTFKGETQTGIYSLEANHLKIYVGTANNRPKDFTPTSGQGLYTLVREKP